MTELFRVGDRVRASRVDPPHHTRLPRYARGAAGTVTGLLGRHPLPDLRSRQLAADPEPVYEVAFAAGELFGEGDHTVTIDLWESYLQPLAVEPPAAATPATPAGEESPAATTPATPAGEEPPAATPATPARETMK